jgi:adenylate cyclase
MEKDQLSRKLAVILHADVVGSTSLVQKNEALAHERIQAAFNRFSETITSNGGIAREIRGDALVAEFERASDAVTASLAFQILNRELNSTIKDEIQPQLRIGINLGEVIVADNTITGTGVVLAQRLEQLAGSGGVVVQGSVSETVPTRMPFDFESLGEQKLKGFDQPVRAFSASLRSGEELPASEGNTTLKTEEPRVLQVPEQPSIAVLPFTNMSAEPEQDFFADGMTEDIITALSKVSSMMVIARNSTFIYKGKAVDVRQVGRDLGVRYVLEGGVRKAGQRVRITAQLIDAATGKHRWAERYDRDLEDIFAVQDEITRKIVSELDVHLRLGEEARLMSGGTDNLEAWECVRTGADLLDGYRTVDVPEALRLAQKAIDIDPEYAQAWGFLAACHWHAQGQPGVSAKERERLLKSTQEYNQKALKIDPSSAHSIAGLALYDLHLRKYDDAVRNVRKSVKFAPNNAGVLALSAAILVKCGQPQIAFEQIQKAMRLSPVYPWWYLMMLGQSARLLGMTDVTIDAYSEIVRLDSDSFEGLVGLAQILGESGKIREARATAAEVLRVDPEFSISEWVGNLAYSDPAEILRYAEGLRKAGLPE